MSKVCHLGFSIERIANAVKQLGKASHLLYGSLSVSLPEQFGDLEAEVFNTSKQQQIPLFSKQRHFRFSRW